MTATDMVTNPFGRSFLSYRRSARSDVECLIAAQRTRGIPTWRDLDDLDSELTGDALANALESPDTASAVCWITPDVADSHVIQRVELPRVLRRVRTKDAFFAEFVLAHGLDYGDVDDALRGMPTLDSLSNGWNVMKVGHPVSQEQIYHVARRVLTRRLRAIAAHDSGALRLLLHTRADAPLPFSPDTALQLDWCPFFNGRCARASVWETNLFPALRDVIAALQRECHDREIIASGKCAIPAAFALGRAFAEPSGLRLTWRQHTGESDHAWSLCCERESSGFRIDSVHADLGGQDIALMINIRGDVEPAVRATHGLPRFAVITRVAQNSRRFPTSINTPGHAVDLARAIVDELRRLRAEHPYASRTHIFLAGPVGLAVLIGQQLNGLGPVQTYEHLQGNGAGTYAPAALLTDHLQSGGIA